MDVKGGNFAPLFFYIRKCYNDRKQQAVPEMVWWGTNAHE